MLLTLKSAFTRITAIVLFAIPVFSSSTTSIWPVQQETIAYNVYKYHASQSNQLDEKRFSNYLASGLEEEVLLIDGDHVKEMISTGSFKKEVNYQVGHKVKEIPIVGFESPLMTRIIGSFSFKIYEVSGKTRNEARKSAEDLATSMSIYRKNPKLFRVYRDRSISEQQLAAGFRFLGAAIGVSLFCNVIKYAIRRCGL